MASASRVAERQPIWQGTLAVRHEGIIKKKMSLIATWHSVSNHPPLVNATFWPKDILCDGAYMKSSKSAGRHINASGTQWFVHFATVDGEGTEGLWQLTEALFESKVVFAIPLALGPLAAGTLYIFCKHLLPHGNSLVGVFRPPELVSRSGVQRVPILINAMPPVGAVSRTGGTELEEGSVRVPAQESHHLPVLVTAPVATEEAGDDIYVWEGNVILEVSPAHKDERYLNEYCVAIAHCLPTRPSVNPEHVYWPCDLGCDSAMMKSYIDVKGVMNDARTQCYVRFIPVHFSTNEKIARPSRFVGIARDMYKRRIAFEIPCSGRRGREGSVYIWGAHVPQHGYSILGAFRPKT